MADRDEAHPHDQAPHQLGPAPPALFRVPESTNRGLVTTVYGRLESGGITKIPGYGQNALAFTVQEDN